MKNNGIEISISNLQTIYQFNNTTTFQALSKTNRYFLKLLFIPKLQPASDIYVDIYIFFFSTTSFQHRKLE